MCEKSSKFGRYSTLSLQSTNLLSICQIAFSSDNLSAPDNNIMSILWRVGCLPLIISISPSLNRRPSPGSRREWVCERGGALKQPGLAACDEAHLKWMEPHHRRCYMPSAPLLWRPVSSPCMHAGVLVGPGRERGGTSMPPETWAAGPVVRTKPHP